MGSFYSHQMRSDIMPSLYKIKNTENYKDQQTSYNENKAGQYEEFEVVKVNKNKPKQIRTLGIDKYNVYNLLPKSKSNRIIILIHRYIYWTNQKTTEKN
jgi:hypothetical protein